MNGLKIIFCCLQLFAFAASAFALNTVKTPLGQVRSSFIVKKFTQCDATIALNTSGNHHTSWTTSTSESENAAFSGTLSNEQLTSLANSLTDELSSVTNLTSSQVFEALTVIPLTEYFGVNDIPTADENLQISIDSFDQNELSLFLQVNPSLTAPSPPPSAILSITNCKTTLMVSFSAQNQHGEYLSNSLSNFFIPQENTSEAKQLQIHNDDKDPSNSDEDASYGCMGKLKQMFCKGTSRRSSRSSFDHLSENSPLISKQVHSCPGRSYTLCTSYQKNSLSDIYSLHDLIIVMSMIAWASKQYLGLACTL